MFKFLSEIHFQLNDSNLKRKIDPCLTNLNVFKKICIIPTNIITFCQDSRKKSGNFLLKVNTFFPHFLDKSKIGKLRLVTTNSEIHKSDKKTNLELNNFLFSNDFQAQRNSNNLVSDLAENLNLSDKKTQNRSNFRFNESSKQQVVSITYEEIGLFPRSFNRVFDRFFKQLFFDVENLVIQEYRFYRYLFLTTVKCLFILIFVPLSVNFIAKNYLVHPITEYYWNTNQSEIFLNSYQQKRAYTQLQEFEEKIYFESLIIPFSSKLETGFQNLEYESGPNVPIQRSELQDKRLYLLNSETQNFQKDQLLSIASQKNSVNNGILNKFQEHEQIKLGFSAISSNQMSINEKIENLHENQKMGIEILTQNSNTLTQSFNQLIQKRLQEKTIELAIHYNDESIEAITNFFADLISFGTLCFLIVNLEIQINITKSFLLEVFFGLDDSKKSLLILFLTDLLVGYHSPNIWELFFQSLFDHYGLPESETTIFLLVATLPVLLDVLFKYLIFRHLNRASPATVATYHAMIE